MSTPRRPGRLLVVTGASLASIILTACSSGSSTPQTAPAAGSASPATAASSSSTTPGESTTSAATIRNLTVTPSVRAALTRAFVSHKAIPASSVAGTVPGSVYYAVDPTTGTSWALAQFIPSSTAGNDVLVGFQDGGSFGLFTTTSGGSWTVETGYDPPACAESKFYPATVRSAWGLPPPTAAMQC
jgi:hypothetical protein